MRISEWSLAFFVSIALHLAAAAGYMLSPVPEPSGASDLGENGIQIGLGMQGSYIDQIEKEKKQKLEKKTKPEKKVISKPVTKAPKKTNKPVKKPAPTVAAVTTKKPTKDAVLVQHSEQKKPAQLKQTAEPEDPEVTEKPKAPEEAEEQTSNTKEQSKSEALVRASGKGAEANSRNRLGKKDYFSSLIAWLNQYKNYPAALKKKKQEGVVTLKFTINKKGQLLSASVHKSSGYPLLDKAALDILDKASPMPAIPNSIPRDQLTLIIPLEYSLITNSTY
ncbi:energy transducer TonB [Cycloclasticus pugetii]|jgi:protein TonB|uniref:energy transducer TonB n=1 Tax=Cycloclasticus pugetii TaxID=34068 RepID=UPI0039E2C563